MSYKPKIFTLWSFKENFAYKSSKERLRPPSQGLAHASHLIRATSLPFQHPPLPRPPLCVPQSPAGRNGLSPQGGYLRRDGGGPGVGSTHRPPQALGALARA